MSGRAVRVALLCALMGGVTVAQPSAKVTLVTKNGVLLLSGLVSAGKLTTLRGVWGPAGQARLMQCLPRCKVVQSIPVQRQLSLNELSGYRVVLGGSYTKGHKVALVMRFGDGQVLNVMTPVVR